MKKRYVDTNMVMAALSLRGDETQFSEEGSDRQRRSYEIKMAYEIAEALEKGAVDAILPTRCKDCLWCLKSYGLRQPKCICPQMPAHAVEEEGFCNFGKPKGGGSNAETN